MLSKRLLAILGILCLSYTGVCAEATLRFSNVLTDNMVLQRDQDLNCWGLAKKGATVEILFTQSRQEVIAFVGEKALEREEKKQSKAEALPPKMGTAKMTYVIDTPATFKSVRKSITAGDDGKWKTTLGQHSASFTPTYLAAKSGEESVAIKNLLIGEVWIASGQSNMRWGGRAGMWEGKGLLPSAYRTASHQAGSSTPVEDIGYPIRWNVVGEGAGGSTIGYFFGKFLHEQLKVPVGMINIAQGGSYASEWCSREALSAMDSPTLVHQLKSYDEKLKSDPEFKGTRGPATMFNGRLYPIRHLNVAGVIYLQGENEALSGQLPQYNQTFPGVIASYRKALERPDLPFGIITLQGMGSSEGYSVSKYSIARDIHLQTHKVTPNTGYIVAHDIGGGIHPTYKRPLAERATYWALRDVYGVVKKASRTRIKEVTFEGSDALVSFETVELKDGKWVNPKPVWPRTNDQNYIAGFMIAGADKKWYPGKIGGVGVLDGPTTLTISNPMVDKPVALRYGWEGWSKGNLGPFHDPVRPYRTDDWPLLPPDEVWTPESGKPNISVIRYGEAHDSKNRQLELPLQQGVKGAGINLFKRHADPKPMMLELLTAMEVLLSHFDADKYKDLAPELREKAMHTVPPRYWRRDRLSPPPRIAKWGWLIERVFKLEQFPETMEKNLADPAINAKLEALKTAVAELKKEIAALQDSKTYTPEELIDKFLPLAEKEKEALLKKNVDLRKLEKEMHKRRF